MQLTGLQTPSKFKATLVGKDELFYKGWEIVKDKVAVLSDLNKTYASNGISDKALHYAKAANMYFYYIHLLICIKEDCDTNGYTIDSEEVIEKYRLECVKEHLICLSKYYGTDYTTTFTNLINSFFSTSTNTYNYFKSFSDWYVPTIGDLITIYNQLFLYNLGSFSGELYISSTPVNSVGNHYFSGFDLSNNLANTVLRTGQYKMRPVREFSSTTSYQIRDVGPSGGYIFNINNGVYFECAPVEFEIETIFGGDAVTLQNQTNACGSNYQYSGGGICINSQILDKFDSIADYNNAFFYCKNLIVTIPIV